MKANRVTAEHGRRAGSIAAMLLTTVLVLSGTLVQAQEGGAKSILKAMSDYVSGQQTIQLTFDSDIEVITPQLEKIQFTNSGKALLSRPDKLHARRIGGYADVELIFDGKTSNGYAKFEGPARPRSAIVVAWESTSAVR